MIIKLYSFIMVRSGRHNPANTQHWAALGPQEEVKEEEDYTAWASQIICKHRDSRYFAGKAGNADSGENV